jgi:hypothetical protein
VFYVPESYKLKKVFHLYLPSDALHYLCVKLNDQSVIKSSTQTSFYYDTLKTESGSRMSNIVYLCILMSCALVLLCKVLRVGVGASGLRPSKSYPAQYIVQ